MGPSHLFPHPTNRIVLEPKEHPISIETRTTDAKARLVLPKSFASSTVLVEQISPTELRVRRARVVAESDAAFAEESSTPLSNRDRDHFLSLLQHPPAPTRALKAAARRHKARLKDELKDRPKDTHRA